MSAQDYSVYAFSPELVALCQSQVRLLQQGLRVDWGGVYLRVPEEVYTPLGEETELSFIPIAVYPTYLEAETSITTGLISLPRLGHFPSNFSLPMGNDPFSLAGVPVGDGESLPPGALMPLPTEPLVLPLLYQEMMLGVLVASRTKDEWQASERQQLEAVAYSLAIACVLDRRQAWYQNQWQRQQQRQQWEHDHWDDLLHQLRNPITALRTFGKLLLKRWTGDDKTQGIIQGIVREGEHLQDLLVHFERDVTAVEANSLEADEEMSAREPAALLPSRSLSLVPLSLQQALEPVILAIQAIAEERHLALTVPISESEPWIHAQAAALREVLSNLLDNAVKYSPDGGQIFLTYRSHTIAPEAWIGLEIADTGYGIPPDDQQHIFERHYRGQQARGPIPGSGLGLAIVKELMEAMQGQIEVISPNHADPQGHYPGTSFRLWFRRADPLIHP
ncbi:GAF domain-containing sensor histidine kinase [Synechocystis sp. LKSZ1]|uniref:GAF domain-containing sensor histidine kinase n=1 Tax=Synechocystis sp. LKSZ1 TaxID=3144951 RepID=UPI00336BFF9A